MVRHQGMIWDRSRLYSPEDYGQICGIIDQKRAHVTLSSTVCFKMPNLSEICILAMQKVG